MKSFLITAIAVVALTFSASAAEFYVSPSGSSSGNGSTASPWDLQTALEHPGSVKPGDTIWLRGGVYHGTYLSRLSGTSSAPIIVRQYPGERATIDGGSSVGIGLRIYGPYTWFWGFEIMFSNPTRYTSGSTNTGFPPLVGDSLATANAAGTRFINMVFHDGCQGLNIWSPAPDSEAYGNLIYNIGFDGWDRGHGHGIYMQNLVGEKLLEDNIIFNTYSHGIHGYTSGSGLNNISIRGNIVFNNGWPSNVSSYAGNILLGGEPVAQNPVMSDNYTYYPPNANRGYNNLGYSGGCSNMKANGNYLVGNTALELVRCPGDLSGNTFYGTTPGFSSSTYPNNTYLSSRPSGVKVFVRPNKYERGRANIMIYNWNLQNSVAVDLSQVLQNGEEFVVKDAMNFYGPAIVSGTYSGQPIQIPVGSLTVVAQPKGSPVKQVPHMAPEIAALVVLPKNATVAPPLNKAPQVSIQPVSPVLASVPAALNGSVTDDGFPSGTTTVQWSKVSGPGTVSFVSPNSAQTAALFSADGAYTLRLSANDSELSNHADVQVEVRPGSTGGGGGASLGVGLAGHWSFDQGTISGNLATDGSGNNWHATIAGTVRSELGVSGQALKLDGQQDFLKILADTSLESNLQLLRDMSLAAWVRTSSGRSEGIISKYDAGGMEYGYLLKTLPGGSLALQIGGANMVNGAQKTLDSGRRINDSQWHHIAAVIRLGANVDFYVDGVLVSSQICATKPKSSATDLWIGRNHWTGYGEHLTGSIDEVMIHARALSAAEVAQIATGGAVVPTPGPTPVPDPVAVTVSPSTVTLGQGQQQTFTATVTGTANSAVTWTISPQTGLISSNGAYTAPAAITNAQTVTVTATSVSDSSKSGTAQISLTPPPPSSGGGTTAPPPAPGSGLAAHWSFDPASISGNQILDGSGNQLNATVMTTLKTEPGPAGQALTMDGRYDYLRVNSDQGANTPLQLLGDLSMSVWIRTSSGRSEGIMSKYDAAGAESGYMLKTVPGGGIGLRIGGANMLTGRPVELVANRPVNDGQWHHVAVVIRLGSDVTFYVDGQLVSSQPCQSRSGASATAFWIGRNGWVGYGEHFTGAMDEASVYNRALAAQEVTDVAAGGSITPSLPPVTVAVAVSPGQASLTTGESKSFSAVVTGASNSAVTWKITPPVGNITSGGVYAAPATISQAQTVTVTATSVVDSGASGDAIVTLTPPPPPSGGGGSTTPPPTTTAPGTSGHWTFDQGTVTGNRAQDSSANQFEATIWGAVNTVAGRVGQALVMDGAVNYLRVLGDTAADSPLELLGDLTIRAWVKTTSARSEGIVSKYDAAGDEAGYLLKTLAGGAIGLRIGGKNMLQDRPVELVTNQRINDGQWHHVAVAIRLGNDVAFYVDGIEVSRQPCQSRASANGLPLWIGRNGWVGYGTYLTGLLDEVAVHQGALSAQEISQLAQGSGGGPAPAVPSPDFSLSANSNSASLTAGGSAVYTISASPTNGFSGTVALSVTGLPGGANAVFSPATITNGSGSATLNVSTSAGVATGTHSLEIKGVSGSLSRTLSVTMTVNAPSGGASPGSGSDPGAGTGTDIGNPTLQGGSTSNGSVYTVNGAGRDIWENSDQFRYHHWQLNGDGEIIARMTSQARSHEWAKAGVMIRAGLSGDSPYGLAGFTQVGSFFQYRSAAGDQSHFIAAQDGANLPLWFRVQRQGDKISVFNSSDGKTWRQIGPSMIIPMSTTAYAGLAVSSHIPSAISTATFDNVSITGGTSGSGGGGPAPGAQAPSGKWSFDQGSWTGLVTADSSGNGLDATVWGQVNVGPGRAGQALVLDGKTNYLRVIPDTAKDSPLQLLGDLTIGAWVKTSSTRTEGIVSKYNSAGEESGYLLKTTPAGSLALRLGGLNMSSGRPAEFGTNSRINDGQWHHVAVVIRIGRDVTFYVDGNQVSQQSCLSAAHQIDTPFLIGRNGWVGYGTYFTGSLDEVVVYRKAMSAQEVAAMQNQ